MNVRGVLAIYKFEMHRFRRTLWTGMAVPVITTCLYFIVFGSAIGSRMTEINGIPYGAFIVPGLMMLSLFTENIIVALENIRLNEVIGDNQREIIYRIGELVESRSKESGLHVKRVALYTELFCKLLGMNEDRCELIKRASPLHDIGKVGIPDAILHKPGKLTPEEWEIMKTHAQLGQDMLSGSDLALFQIGATIAGNHHEKWNGSGYPRGLKGEDIPLEGRIVALADVFDALGSDRCYKQAWPLDQVLALIKEEKGEHFDPLLVDLMLANLEKFLDIREQYKDIYIGAH